MADISGTNLVAPVVPFTTDDSYPTHMAQYGKGGWRSVQTKAELATIPSQRLEVGMVAYVITEHTPYVYDGSDWKALVIEMDLSKVATEATLIAGIASIEEKIENSLPNEVASLATTLEQYCPGEHPNLFKPDSMGVWYVFTGELVDGGGYKCRAVHNTTGVPNYISVHISTDGATAIILQNGVETTESYPISKENIKTVSLTAILDAVGNIQLDKSDLAKQESLSTSTNNILSALSGISASMYKGIPVVYDEDDDNVDCYPNTYYICGERSELNIHRMEPTNIDIVNNYIFRFTASQDGMNVTLNGWDEISWFGGSIPTWVAGNTYEISIVDNIALWAEFEPAV